MKYNVKKSQDTFPIWDTKDERKSLEIQKAL